MDDRLSTGSSPSEFFFVGFFAVSFEDVFVGFFLVVVGPGPGPAFFLVDEGFVPGLVGLGFTLVTVVPLPRFPVSARLPLELSVLAWVAVPVL